MRARDVVLAFSAALAACASNPDTRERPIEWVQRDGHGGWVLVERTAGPAIAGELIAAEPDTMRVLAGASLIAVPRSQVQRAELWAWETQEGREVAWGALGTASTISHGVFLIFSFPVWLFTSVATAASESRASRLIYPDEPWAALVKWARFPQGLPAGIGAAALVRQDRPPA